MKGSRRMVIGAVSAAVGLLVAGCGGSSGGSTEFTKADLAGIVLKRSEAPRGLVY